MSDDGYMGKGRDKAETGPARAGRQPGVNGDSQGRANVSTESRRDRELAGVQVWVPGGGATGEVKSLNMGGTEVRMCSEESMT